MAKVLFAGVVCAAAALTAAPLELGMGMNGDVRVGDTGARLAMTIHHAGWRGTATGVRTDFAFPDPATGTATFEFFEEKRKCAHGRATLLPIDGGRAALSATVTSDLDQKPEALVLNLSLPCETCAGATWKTSVGKAGTISKTWDGKTVGIWSGEVAWIEFTPLGRDAFRLTFPEPTHVMLQDDRTWVQTISVRIYPGGGARFNAGDQRTFLCILSSKDGVNVSIDRPVVVQAGEEWIPLDYRKDIEAGSALDFSNQGLQDAPAGKHGWLKSVGGHFEFENLPGRRQRFYGVNLCFDANFPDHAFADQLVTRLVRLGYNTVRIHHYESANGVVKDAADGLALNPERMDRLDYLLAKLIEKGVYVTTDLFTTRPVAWRAIGIDRDGRVGQQEYKNLIPVHEGAYRNWAAFTKNLLTHVNKYTGRAYKDEPGLPLISLINEGHLTWCWESLKHEEPLKKAWAAWLAEMRARDAGYAKGCDDPEKIPAWNNAALIAFMAHIERRLVARQRAFLKELGVKALLTNQNCGGHYTPLMAVREDLYDYVDDHFYVDHPSFLARPWSLPSWCGNANPVLAESLPPVACAYTRMPTKPFCITEWNFSGPGMFRGVGGIMTGAMSALQDWDGLWRFAYSHGLDNMRDRTGAPGYFDVASDPLGQAGDRASLCLFLRGDLQPLADMVVNQVTPDTFLPASGRPTGVVPRWRDAAWQIRTGTALAPVPGVTTVPLKDQFEANQAPVALKPNAAIELDRARGAFRIVTPKTSGGFTPGGVIESGAVSFDAGDVATTVWASSLDGQAIPQSRRILVTHLTDVQANGNVYADKEKRTLLRWGTYPPVVRSGAARVSLALADPSAYAVWALETTGRRLEKMPCSVDGGRLVFTAAVKGPNGARMLYEVVRE
ncbi:MAG: hypothetical protein ACI4RA_10750 [Kiritimatiellia bacterium]